MKNFYRIDAKTKRAKGYEVYGIFTGTEEAIKSFVDQLTGEFVYKKIDSATFSFYNMVLNPAWKFTA